MSRTLHNRYFEGTITSGDIGADGVPAVLDMLNSRVVSSIDGVPSWDLYDTVASDDLVYRSLGDRILGDGAGDARAFIQIRSGGANAVAFEAWRDWSSVDGDGPGVALSKNWTLTASTKLDYIGAVNEHEFIIYTLQGSNHRFLWFGTPFRDHVMASHRGVCYSTQAITGTGSAQTVTVDRDQASSFRAGQTVWIRDTIPFGQAKAGFNNTYEVVTLTNPTATTIDINPSGNFLSDALIGHDPSPVYMHTTAGQFICSEDSTGADVLRTWGTWVSNEVPGEANADPAGLGYGLAGRIGLKATAVGAEYRGLLSLCAAFPSFSSPSAPDRIASGFTEYNRTNFDDNAKWAPIEQFKVGAFGTFWPLNVGPWSVPMT